MNNNPKNLSSNKIRLSPSKKTPSTQANLIKSNNNYIINNNQITNRNVTPCSPLRGADLNYKDLLFNVNDDHKTLIMKNAKLRNLLIEASNKLIDYSNRIKQKEDEYKIEKSGILVELDKITINYKTYAEGYKNFSNLQEEFKKLQKDYEHNYNVLISYQESLR